MHAVRKNKADDRLRPDAAKRRALVRTTILAVPTKERSVVGTGSNLRASVHQRCGWEARYVVEGRRAQRDPTAIKPRAVPVVPKQGGSCMYDLYRPSAGRVRGT